MIFGVGIIGCGLIGQKRANSLGTDVRLIACADINLKASEYLAQQHQAIAYSDWQKILEHPHINIVIIATPHASLAKIALLAIQSGKHVFIEKPAARTAQEILPLIKALHTHAVKVRVGFNHRYHPAIRQARNLFESGALGTLMFIRARYGHGGRLGYDKEWRANPALSGGGELIDQGAHLIDLSRWFLGEFSEIEGFSHTYYWDMPVEDNSFMLLKTSQQQVAFLHASCTEWKNLFSMEIYGHQAKLEVSGLGGSYGVEKLAYYAMRPEMGPPDTTIWEYPMQDDSWSVEINEFYQDILLNREPSPGLNDAYKNLEIIQLLYKKSGYDYCS